MRLFAQLVAMRKEMRENQLEQSRRFDIQQQTAAKNTRNIKKDDTRVKLFRSCRQ